MSPVTYTCQCGAELRYRQDLRQAASLPTPTWHCSDCDTPVPGTIAEQIKHQHPR